MLIYESIRTKRARARERVGEELVKPNRKKEKEGENLTMFACVNAQDVQIILYA